MAVVVDTPPLSVRHPWQRVTMLATLMFLMAMPWLTSTGCQGDKPPTTSTGFELFAETINSDPVFWLAPLGLFVAALTGIAVVRVRSAKRRLALVLVQFVVVVAGAFFTLVATELPRAGDTVTHEFAGVAGGVVLVALVVEALVRVVLAVRELWVGRRTKLREERFADVSPDISFGPVITKPKCF
ncbi:MAG: hypothetical protein Q8O67_03200 [Deltaproteobacteria bacterium]|nr:hypothetical protein [Deltaproteobacteria bacterium]